MEYNVTYRQKDKSIQAIISYKDNNGNWKQKSKQGFKTQKEAKPIVARMLKAIELKLLNEKDIVSSDYTSVTFRELSDAFINHSKIYKEDNTIKGYKNAKSNFELIFEIKVIVLKKSDLLKCIDAMVEKKLRYITIASYVRRVNLMFEYYKENYDPNFSIDLNFKLPKDKDVIEKKALTKTQLNKLLNSDKLKNSKFYIVAYIAANTGLRVGEILGLIWNDFNKKEMYIDVNKQYKKLKDGTYGFGILKSKNSYRKVPISNKIVCELEKYKSINPIQLDKRISPFNKNSIDKYLNPLLNELAGISIHELRHTYITLLVSSNIDFKTIAKIAGHDVEQTLKTYSHVNDDMFKNASDTIAKIF